MPTDDGQAVVPVRTAEEVAAMIPGYRERPL
jgi:hypothetical protein